MYDTLLLVNMAVMQNFEVIFNKFSMESVFK
jgi:hypothetical protein